MKLDLRAVVLWPRDSDREPRVVKFLPGRINVITGGSKTGKSAIIPIVDYCLGSGKCTIPVGPIRDSCSWFGALFESEQGQHLFARREPGDQQSTNEMYVREGENLEIPRTVERNATVDAVKEHLNDLSGLTRLNFQSDATATRYWDRPSFRDMAAFLFQPQNVVANPAVLFYKADSQDHRDKLRTIFPYVLGAVTPEVLALQHEARRLQLELRRKEREYRALSEVSSRWHAELRSRVVTARELGLVNEGISDDLSLEEMLDVLRQIPMRREGPVSIRLGTISGAVGELLEVEREESVVSAELAGLRQRYAEMSRLRESGNEYRQALDVKLDRLSLADWMLSIPAGEKGCPICGAKEAGNREEVDRLGAAMREVESEFRALSRVPASFDREQQRVSEEIQIATEKLEGLRIRRLALVDRSDEVREQQFTQERIDLFLGSLHQALETFSRLGAEGDLAEEIELLRERLEELRERISLQGIAASTRRALNRFSVLAQRIVPKMDVERPDDALHLSISDLTLKVEGSNREDYLWEIGSGANWVAYHVATILALHSLFLQLDHSPVPSFCILDQPSQVYFPRPSIVEAARSGPDDPEPRLADEDLEAVRMIFSTLSDAAIDAGGHWQAVVLDHAGETVWGGLPGVHLVEVWREGRRLVPTEWLKSEA